MPNTAVFSMPISLTSRGTTMVGPKNGAMDSQRKLAAHTPCMRRNSRNQLPWAIPCCASETSRMSRVVLSRSK